MDADDATLQRNVVIVGILTTFALHFTWEIVGGSARCNGSVPRLVRFAVSRTVLLTSIEVRGQGLWRMRRRT